MIWIDGDALPKPAKEALIKALKRTKQRATWVANSRLLLPNCSFLTQIIVPKTPDSADHVIAENVQPPDVVITSDIALAFAVLKAGAAAFTGRGVVFSKETIGAKLNNRDFTETLRSSGVMNAPTQKPYSDKDKKLFCDALNCFLQQI